MAGRKFDSGALPIKPDLCYENALWAGGIRYVAGIDEAGRGALAGPVFAAAVVLPVGSGIAASLSGVRDSKQMSPTQRQEWAQRIRSWAAGCGVGHASHIEIDALGISRATRLAMLRALQNLPAQPQHLLLDFVRLPEVDLPQTSLVKGDARCLSIAAASILAKTGRDEWMRQLDLEYPDYQFARHKGYGTLVHRQALAAFGPSPVHRASFSVKSL